MWYSRAVRFGSLGYGMACFVSATAALSFSCRNIYFEVENVAVMAMNEAERDFESFSSVPVRGIVRHILLQPSIPLGRMKRIRTGVCDGELGGGRKLAAGK